MQASLAPSLYAETARARNTILGASFCVACVLVVLALQTVDNSHSAVSLSIFTILMSGFTAWRRFRYHGVEPLALFCLLSRSTMDYCCSGWPLLAMIQYCFIPRLLAMKPMLRLACYVRLSPGQSCLQRFCGKT